MSAFRTPYVYNHRIGRAMAARNLMSTKEPLTKIERAMSPSNPAKNSARIKGILPLILGGAVWVVCLLMLSVTAVAHLQVRKCMEGNSSDSRLLQVFATGLLDPTGPNLHFWRNLETRIFIVYGLLLLLGLLGIALVFPPKGKTRHSDP